MAVKYIWVKDKRYYLYGTYDTWDKAKEEALKHRKKNKCRYFIIKVEQQGFLDIVPEIKFQLFLDKALKIW